MTEAAAILIAYLLGGIPFGYLLVRLKTGRDVRSMGSGNIGATNVLRTTSRALGIVTLLLDVAKGFAAVEIARVLAGGAPAWMAAAALAVMAGHAYPVFLKFRGGKAVASYIGAFLYLAPLPLLGALIVFVIVVARWRYISLGSMVAAAVFPALVWAISHPPAPIVFAAAIAGAFIIWRHKENISRLRAGKEHALSFGGQRA
jgi:glycerol-3-phosphate acyltransferase PlsY